MVTLTQITYTGGSFPTDIWEWIPLKLTSSVLPGAGAALLGPHQEWGQRGSHRIWWALETGDHFTMELTAWWLSSWQQQDLGMTRET